MKESYIKVSVKGHNINNYLKWLINKKIDILEGEHELLKQLGLNGLERATHCDEYPIL